MKTFVTLAVLVVLASTGAAKAQYAASFTQQTFSQPFAPAPVLAPACGASVGAAFAPAFAPAFAVQPVAVPVRAFGFGFHRGLFAPAVNVQVGGFGRFRERAVVRVRR